MNLQEQITKVLLENGYKPTSLNKEGFHNAGFNFDMTRKLGEFNHDKLEYEPISGTEEIFLYWCVAHDSLNGLEECAEKAIELYNLLINNGFEGKIEYIPNRIKLLKN